MPEENLNPSANFEPEESCGGTPRIGLCLSGGGFRASFFHLGTIRYLEEVGIMEKVEVFSTVSGGSIVGAYYLVEMERKRRAHRQQENFNRLIACDEIVQEFWEEVDKNLRMRAIVFRPFFHPVLSFLELLRLRHRGDAMAKEFERHFFSPRLRVGALPVQSQSGRLISRILINTTSLVSGLRIVFSRESDTGLKSQIKKSDPNQIPLARVVGASAAVPGFFKPLYIGNDVLADGGIVDNQGIESLLDYFEISDPAMNLLPTAFRQHSGDKNCKPFFIVSDGAGQFSIRTVKKATRWGSAMRSVGILQASNRRKVLKLLLDLGCDKKDSCCDQKIEAFAFTHLAENIKGSDCDGGPVERLPSELIVPTAQIRTDLDEFSCIERDVLIYHGYTLMKNRIEEYCKKLLEKENNPKYRTRNEEWPPSFVKLVDPSKSNSECARRSRIRLECYLDCGRARFFRDVRRFPWFFGPILAIFGTVGGVFSHILRFHQIPSIEGTVKDCIEDRIIDIVVCLIPNFDSPWNYTASLEKALCAKEGTFVAAIELSVTIFCIGISFYIALFVYWLLKRCLRLPEWAEKRMLENLMKIKNQSRS